MLRDYAFFHGIFKRAFMIVSRLLVVTFSLKAQGFPIEGESLVRVQSASGACLQEPDVGSDAGSEPGKKSEAIVSVKQFSNGNNRYFVVTLSSHLEVTTVPGIRNYDLKRCTIDLDIQLGLGDRLDSFELNALGRYQVSERGVSRLTMSHKVGTNYSRRFTGFYSLSGGSPAQGTLFDPNERALVTVDQLPRDAQVCGAHLPWTVSYFLSANQPSEDRSGVTSVALGGGVPSTADNPFMVRECGDTACLGVIKIKQCMRSEES